MEDGECTEYDIHTTGKCQRRHNKNVKKMNPRLHGIIESELDALGGDPCRGSRLEWNLAGLRSVHVGEFAYRIVYKANRVSCTVTIVMIGHRDGIYDELARLQRGG